MKVAVDIDGTLTAWPRVVAELTKALASAGHDVVLLTGCSVLDQARADMDAMQASRHRQVAPFGAVFREIVICVGRNSDEVSKVKAAYCRDQGIDLFLDDSDNYCRDARKESPGTMTLKVMP